MSAPDAQVAEVTRHLLRDVRATLGANYGRLVREEAALVRTFAEDPEQYVEALVTHVQQRVHDEHIDTIWPACPRHPRHPLWYRAGFWRCEQDGFDVALVGELDGTGNKAVE